MKLLIISAVRTYQAALSPLLPFNHCRYFPSCSEYVVEAVEKHGVLTGLRLGIQRVLRCHPFHSHHGYDPVPDPKATDKG